VRLDEAGNEIWQRGQESTRGCYWKSVQETDDRGYIVAGYCGSLGILDLCMAKLDLVGRIEWQKVLGRDPAYQRANDVRQTRDLGYIVLGSTDRGAGDQQHRDIWALRLDSSGNEIWSETFGQPGVADTGFAVAETQGGGFIVAGRTYVDGSARPWLVSLDGAGMLRWQKAYDFLYAPSWVTGLHPTEDRGFLLAGSAERPNESDLILLKVDAAGEVQWGGRSFIAYSSGIAPTGDGGFIVVGKTGLFGAGGAGDVWALRFDDQGLLSQDCSAFERIPVVSEDTSVIADPYTSPQRPYRLMPTSETLPHQPTTAVSEAQCLDCTPPQPSSQSSPHHLKMLGRDGPILLEWVPDATAYNLYVDLLSSWYFPTIPLGTSCRMTNWADNGDGTILLDHSIPVNSWIVASASNSCGESGAGRDSTGQERTQVGSWEPCPLGP
jgi:hypothetical protein